MTQRYTFRIIVLLACVGASVVTCVLVAADMVDTALAQQSVPSLTGRVVDLAGMIGAEDKAAINARLKAHEQKTSNQIVVLTVPTLQGDAIEAFSLRVARSWALGQKGRDNGVLFLIAQRERTMRIEVGYGLEATLTDAITSFIIRRTVAPLFKQGLFNGGIVAGTGQIIEVLESDETSLGEWRERTQENGSKGGPDFPLYLFVALWLMLLFGGIVSSIFVRFFGREIKPGHYRWLGIDAGPNAPKPKRGSSRSGRGGSSWSGGGGGGFSGGGGSFGGGGSSGGW